MPTFCVLENWAKNNCNYIYTKTALQQRQNYYVWSEAPLGFTSAHLEANGEDPTG